MKDDKDNENVVSLVPKAEEVEEEAQGLTPDELLEEAKGDYLDLVLLGYNKDGVLIVRSTDVNAMQVNWMLDQVKHGLNSGYFIEEE